MKRKAIIAIGIPGAGKTTTVKEFANKNEYVYISPDDIRLELSGDAGNQNINREVWDLAHKRSQAALGSGLTVVIDATFTNKVQRLSFLDFLRKSGADIIQGIFVDTPLEIAKERNSSRERKVPVHVIENYHKFLRESPPELVDGFDSVFILDENKNLTAVETNRIGDQPLRKEFHTKIN